MRRMDYVPHSQMHIILSHESPDDSMKWTAGHGRCGSVRQFAANAQGSPSASCHPILPPPARRGSLSVFVALQMQGSFYSLPIFLWLHCQALNQRVGHERLLHYFPQQWETRWTLRMAGECVEYKINIRKGCKVSMSILHTMIFSE